MPNVVLERSSRVLLALAASALTFFPAAADQRPTLTNTPAPPISLSVIANGSGTFVLKQQLGHPVYINFFASWCEPCKEEVHTLQQVTGEFSSQGLRVIGIAELDQSAAAVRFAHANGLRYPIAADTSSDVGAAYRLAKLPLHVFIDANGIIRQYVEGGPIPASELRAGLAQISKTH